MMYIRAACCRVLVWPIRGHTAYSRVKNVSPASPLSPSHRFLSLFPPLLFPFFTAYLKSKTYVPLDKPHDKSRIQSQPLKHDSSCDIPRALCANARSTSHEKPAVKRATTYVLRSALQHTTPGVTLAGGRGAVWLHQNITGGPL